MSHSNSAEVVHALYDAITREDIAALLSMFDEHTEIVEPPSLPFGGTHRGTDAIRKNLFMVLGRKLRVRISGCRVMGDGDTVAAAADVEFSSRASGRTLLMPYVELHTILNGKVRRIEVFPQDTHRLVEFWQEN